MMYYETYGNKFNPPIMLLHGENYVYSFAKQYELQKNYFLIVPHIPGFGMAMGESFSADAAVAQIAELAESIGRKITLVGFALGAELCLPLICKHTELFNGCMMISPRLIKSMEDIEKALRKLNDNEISMKSTIAVNLSAIQLGLSSANKKAHIDYCKNISINTLAAAVDNGIVFENYPEYSELDMPLYALCGLNEPLEIRKSVMQLSRNNVHCPNDMWDGAVTNIPYKFPSRLNKLLDEFADKCAHKK